MIPRERTRCSFLLLFSSLFIIFLTISARVVFAQDADSAPVNLSQVDASKMVISRVSPKYPMEARQAHIQGQVFLMVGIDKEGNVESVQVASGQPMLAEAAMTAVKKWTYKPYLVDGQPRRVSTQVQVNFTLSDATPPPATRGTAGDAPGGLAPGEPGGIIDAHDSEAGVPKIAAPTRVRISSGVSQGLLLKKVSPAYPEDARLQGIQGKVLLQVLIDKKGNIIDAQLISGHPMLAPAAIEAVKQWKYRPYLLNEQPVEASTQIMVNFTLSN